MGISQNWKTGFRSLGNRHATRSQELGRSCFPECSLHLFVIMFLATSRQLPQEELKSPSPSLLENCPVYLSFPKRMTKDLSERGRHGDRENVCVHTCGIQTLPNAHPQPLLRSNSMTPQIQIQCICLQGALLKFAVLLPVMPNLLRNGFPISQLFSWAVSSQSSGPCQPQQHKGHDFVVKNL